MVDDQGWSELKTCCLPILGKAKTRADLVHAYMILLEELGVSKGYLAMNACDWLDLRKSSQSQA